MDNTLKEYYATFFLSEEDTKRLERITTLYNQAIRTKDSPLPPERVFNIIMSFGAAKIIDWQMDLAEMQLKAYMEKNL